MDLIRLYPDEDKEPEKKIRLFPVEPEPEPTYGEYGTEGKMTSGIIPQKLIDNPPVDRSKWLKPEEGKSEWIKPTIPPVKTKLDTEIEARERVLKKTRITLTKVESEEKIDWGKRDSILGDISKQKKEINKLIEAKERGETKAPPKVSFLEKLSVIPKLLIPGLREKVIKEHPEEVIRQVEKYEQYVGPYVRRNLTTRIPLAAAEKIVGKQLAVSYEELAEKHPVSTAVSGLLGDVYNLVAISQLTGGIGTAIKIPGTAKVLLPTLSRYIPQAITSGTTFGVKGLLDESVSQFEKGSFDPVKLATETGKNFLFGTLLAGPLVMKSVPKQILGSGLVMGGFTAVEEYLRDGTLDQNDMLNIGANAVLGMVFASLQVKSRVRNIQQKEIYNMAHQQLVAKVGEVDAIRIEQAHLATILARTYPNKSMAEIMKMVKMIPASYADIKLPTVLEQQTTGQIPNKLQNIKLLPEAEQAKLFAKSIEITKTLSNQGVPLWSAISQGLESIGFPRIDISPTLPTGPTLTEIQPKSLVKPITTKPLIKLTPETAPVAPEVPVKPITPEKGVIPVKVITRTKPSSIKGAGTRQIIIKDHPEIYTDSFLLLEDRTEKEVNVWREKQELGGKEMDYSNIESLYPKEKTILTKFVSFEKAEHEGRAATAHLDIGKDTSVMVNAEYYQWLNKQGYIIKSTGKEMTPLVLERNGKDVGLLMPLKGGKSMKELGVVKMAQITKEVKPIKEVIPKALQPLVTEARKYKSAREFFERMPVETRDILKKQGIKSREAITNFWNNNVEKVVQKIDSVNPTGSLYIDYAPQERMTLELGKNITTLDKTSGKSPNEIITIYRGAPKIQKEIVPGDFITTNYELAKSYTGEENVLSKEVKMSDILDDKTEPLGEEYIYKPVAQATKEVKPTIPKELRPPAKEARKYKVFRDYKEIHEAYAAGEIKVNEPVMSKAYGEEIVKIKKAVEPFQLDAMGLPIKYRIETVKETPLSKATKEVKPEIEIEKGEALFRPTKITKPITTKTLSFEERSEISKNVLPKDFSKLTARNVEVKMVSELIKRDVDVGMAKIMAENLAPDIVAVFKESHNLNLQERKKIAMETAAFGLRDIRKGEKLPSEQAEEAKLKKPIEKGEALYAKKWDVKMAAKPEITEKINKTQIMDYTEKAFGIPLRTKATHKWRAAGMYYTKQQIIRMEKWGELSVLMHEVAHHIDLTTLKKEYPGGWRKSGRVVQKELADLDYDQRYRRTREGFAEYMRYRMTTNEASDKAPVFHKFFNEFLEKNPQLKTKLAGLKKRMDIWQKQGAENRVIQHIDWKGEHTKIKGIMPKLRRALQFINEKFNDEFYVPQKITREIEKVIGRKLSPTKNPAIMMEYYKSKAGAIARTFVMDNAIDEYGNVLGPGLAEVLKPIPKNEMKQFIAYAVSKRAINLAGRNIESGFDIEDAKFIVNKYQDKGWDEITKNLTEWSNHLLDWVVRAGGIKGKTAQLMRDLNPTYLPFKRAFIDEAGVIKGAGGYVDTGGAIKGIKGSGRPIVNPIEAMIAQARELIAKSQKIRIANAFVDIANEEGVGGFISRVPAPMRATTFQADQIRGYIAGITGGETTDTLDDFLTVFTQDFRYNGKENIVSVWRNGKQEFYEIHPDLYSSFKGIDPLKLGPISKLFAPFSRMLRLGATGLKISFGLARNPFRDAFSYAVFSKRSGATIFDPIKGVYKDITTKPGEATWRFKKLGGALSGQIGLDRAATQSTYDEMLMENLGKTGKTLRIVKHPVDTLRAMLSVTEMGPRSVELEQNYKKYTSEKWTKEHPDWNEEDAFVQAFNDAQDVTVNFTKSGKWARQINQITAFFNVAIRGPEKVYRSFRERPIQTLVKGLVWLTAIAVWSWYKNKDKDWYKNLPPAYKYNNLFFELPGGNVVRLPIPFELGILFMSVPQAALDTAKEKDSKYLKGLLELAKSQIPDPTPSVFQPLLDVWGNKNYLGVPIESAGMQYLYPTERKKDYTSKFAIGMSKGLDKLGISASPIQIDYLTDSYSGGFLRQFRISGSELYDLPILGDVMLRDPNYPRRQLNEYFADWELLKQKKQSDIATKEELKELRKIDGFYDYYKDKQDRIKRADEKGDKELLEKYYKQIIEKLKKYGYN